MRVSFIKTIKFACLVFFLMLHGYFALGQKNPDSGKNSVKKQSEATSQKNKEEPKKAAQDQQDNTPDIGNLDPEGAVSGGYDVKTLPNGTSGTDVSKSANSNIDMRVVYGQYNNMLSTINLSQEQKDFVYLLNTNFKRSSDYGYNGKTYSNSSYYENRLAFTGNGSIGDTFYSTFDTSVDFDSRGMFDKPDYSREEKEKVKIASKNVKKFSDSFEGYFTGSGAFYKHRLEARQEGEDVRNSLNRYTGEIGGEYVWSASNRIRAKSLFTQYNYTMKNVPNDQYLQSEIIDDFKFTNYTMFNFGTNIVWNRDEGLFTWNKNIPVPFMPIAGVSFTPADFLIMAIQYRYDLQPFRPEDYYFDQKYIYPTYNLPPARVHQAKASLDVKLINRVNLKGGVTYENSDNFYNYIPSQISENLLTAHGVKTNNYVTNIDADVKIIDKKLRFITGYQYGYYKASENITYHPINSWNSVIRYTGSIANVDWSNRYIGRVYVNPKTDRTLTPVVVGGLDVQFLTIKSFYAYFRLENLYNSKYYLRDGYPEAGITFLLGLRILI